MMTTATTTGFDWSRVAAGQHRDPDLRALILELLSLPYDLQELAELAAVGRSLQRLEVEEAGDTGYLYIYEWVYLLQEESWRPAALWTLYRGSCHGDVVRLAQALLSR